MLVSFKGRFSRCQLKRQQIAITSGYVCVLLIIVYISSHRISLQREIGDQKFGMLKNELQTLYSSLEAAKLHNFYDFKHGDILRSLESINRVASYLDIPVTSFIDKTEANNLDELTIILNTVHYDKESLPGIPDLVLNMKSLYPNVNLVMGVPETFDFSDDLFATDDESKILKYKTQIKDGEIWSTLIDHVTTEYVYLARDVVELNEEVKFDYLMKELVDMKVNWVGSLTKHAKTKQIMIRCETLTHRFFSIKILPHSGGSAGGRVYCGHTRAPFLTYTRLLKQFSEADFGDASMTGWFLSLSENDKLGVVFPQSIVEVTNRSEDLTALNLYLDWRTFSSKTGIEWLTFPNGERMDFLNGCSGEFKCRTNGWKSMAIPHCCMKSLHKLIYVSTEILTKADIAHEIQDGNMIGMAKFEENLPWELDGDMKYDKNQHERALRIMRESVPEGIIVTIDSGPVIGYYSVREYDWYMELYPLNGIELSNQGLKLDGYPVSITVVKLGERYIPSPINPGLYIRNEYGREVYKHAVHNALEGKTSKDPYITGNFKKCSEPGHKACLDRYYGDGSFQFERDIFEFLK